MFKLAMSSSHQFKLGTNKLNRRIFLKLSKIQQILLTGNPEEKEQLRDELCKQLGITHKRLAEFEFLVINKVPYLNTVTMENIGDPGCSYCKTEMEITISQLMAYIYPMIDSLGDIEKTIVKNRWLENKCSLAEMGKEVGCSRQWCHQLEIKIFNKLKANLIKLGINSI